MSKLFEQLGRRPIKRAGRKCIGGLCFLFNHFEAVGSCPTLKLFLRMQATVSCFLGPGYFSG